MKVRLKLKEDGYHYVQYRKWFTWYDSYISIDTQVIHLDMSEYAMFKKAKYVFENSGKEVLNEKRKSV